MMAQIETEGVIQFAYTLDPPAPADAPAPAKVMETIARPFRLAGFLGRDRCRYGGLAFGNVSLRGDAGYWITASQRMDQCPLAPEDLCWVSETPKQGALQARGLRAPSSESLVHSAVYGSARDTRVVVHGHHAGLWHAHAALGLAATPVDAKNGTDALAGAVRACCAGHPTGCLAMSGHQDGMLFWAPDAAALHQLLGQTLARLSDLAP